MERRRVEDAAKTELTMPLPRFAALILTVIATGGMTVALASWAGFPLIALGLLALVASVLPGLRRWK